MQAQATKRVLFLGNSYTSSNNLPQMVANMASSTGDTLHYKMVAPGGTFLYQHLGSANSLNEITKGNWDHVALQEQSQALTLPSYQIGFTLRSLYQIDSTINHHNTCVETLYYLTWGRKNGDKVFYQVYSGYTDSTYEYMDSLLLFNYTRMADSCQAEVAPAGAVWRYLRDNHPSLELYQADESHPSTLGTFAAACAFYTAIFRKNPMNILFNGSIRAADAQIIKNATHEVVFKNLLRWNIGRFDSLKDSSCATIGISEMPVNLEAEVFPNPFGSYLHVEHPLTQKEVELKVFNAKGELFFRTKHNQTSVVNTEQWPPGLYFIQIGTNHFVKRVKK